jgi:hypothetical protein
MPVWASALILVFSFGFVIWYFIIYPILVERKLKKRSMPALNSIGQ